MKHAIIKNNTVSNVILWDKARSPNYAPDGLSVAIEEGQRVSIGWAYADGQFIEPNPPQVLSEE